MVVLEWNNAVKCLALAAPGLYADLLCDLKEGRDCAFQSHGAVIIKTVWYGSERYIWYLCDTGRCDMAAALMDLKKAIPITWILSAFTQADVKACIA